jgi:hypothetical protein
MEPVENNLESLDDHLSILCSFSEYFKDYGVVISSHSEDDQFVSDRFKLILKKLEEAEKLADEIGERIRSCFKY